MTETIQAMRVLSHLDTKISARRKSVGWQVSHEEFSLGEISRPSSPTSGLGIFTESSTCSKSTKSSSRESSPVSQSPKQAKKDRRPRTDYWAGYAFPSQILSPRPYEQIYAEIGYLTGSLQVEAYNTAKLIGHYALVQDALNGEAAVGKHRRKLRKQLSSLKCRISQASVQERTIIVRLSELHMEAQSRNTWSQVQLWRMFGDSSPCTPSPITPSTASPSTWSPHRRLNAACSDFIPSPRTPAMVNNPYPRFQAEQNVPLPQCTSVSKGETPQPAPTPRSEPVGQVERNDDGGDKFQNHGLEYTYDQHEKAKSPKGTSMTTEDAERKQTCKRRPSLPSMKFTWPET